MNLSELLKSINPTEVTGSDGMEISGIAFNSAEVKPGNLFVCISGFKTDGHKYAPDAVKRGAAAVVAERKLEGIGVTCVTVKNSRIALAKLSAEFYGHPYRKFNLIGITGTNGKTTTTYLVKSILESQGQKVGLIGTNQNLIGGEVIPSKHTTPDSLELMQLFKKMSDAEAESVVMEVSSHSLALDRVTACKFDVAEFTNITQDHLDFHETMEKYLEAKGILFTLAEKGAVNADDSSADYLKAHAACSELITYGIDSDCDLKAENVDLNAGGVNFDVLYKGEKARAELAIPGRFSVYNALAAIACCLLSGFNLNDIIAGLKTAKGVKGRVEIVPTNTDYTVIIDYAHTPDGLYNVINTIRGFAEGRIITLFGCGGDRDRAKRPKMGKIAAELSDFCVVTSDNPRTEKPGDIIKDILEGMPKDKSEYVVIENRFEAIEYALDHAKKNDIILLAGKGHETYQVLSSGKIDFDEREIVTKLLSD